MTPFNWDHPAIKLSHGVRKYGAELPEVPSWVQANALSHSIVDWLAIPRWQGRAVVHSRWTPDRMEAAVSIFCILFAALLGYALGAR